MAKKRIRKDWLQRRIRKHGSPVSVAEFDAARPGSPVRNLRRIPLDGAFLALPLWLWLKILEYSGIDRYRWVENRSDCDKFTLALKGMLGLRLLIGNALLAILDYSGGHAYIGLLVRDRKDGPLRIVLVEPQSDALVAEDSHPAYSLDHGYFLL